MILRRRKHARADADDRPGNVRIPPRSMPVFDFEKVEPFDEVAHWLTHSCGFVAHAQEHDRQRVMDVEG